MTFLIARDGVLGIADAVSEHSTPDCICGAFDGRTFRDVGDPGWQAWDGADRAWNWRGSSEALLPTQPIEIERYVGPLLLSHGTSDRVWSVAMTRRLEARLQAHGRSPEVHYYEGEDHIPRSEAENTHHTQLLGFFARHLAG
nr:prolyl oligopeptidase family serine peptidase [Salinicola acroporae]